MRRVVALTVAISLSASSIWFAGEGVMQSGVRIVQQQATQNAGSASTVVRSKATNAPDKSNGFSAAGAAAMQEGPAVLSKSGLSKRTKVMIYLAAGIGLAGTA